MRSILLPLALSLGGLPAPLAAQLGPGTVGRIRKISNTQGGFGPVLESNDQLGRSVASLGDLDGNGVIDLASSGLGDDDGGADQGAAYVIFLRRDGSVQAAQKISELEGGFTGILDAGDQFGRALDGIGDLDGDGVGDLAVGANYDDDGGMNRGAVWLLLLDSDGTVKQTSKISSTQGGFAGPLRNNDEFGRSVASLGDLDGDGVVDLAVGAPTDGTGGARRGAIWVLFLSADGSVKRHVKIASGMGGFTGSIRDADWFAFSLANLGDLDGDGVVDLAAGAPFDDDGVPNAGAVWLLYLEPDGTVKDQRKISMRSGGFTGVLKRLDAFGTSVARLGDIDGDGISELASGAVANDGGTDRGAVYVLFLRADGTVALHQKLSSLEGNLPVRMLDNLDWFGSALAPLGDLDGDGVLDVVIGARNDDDGAPNAGALYLTYLNGTLSGSEAVPTLVNGEGGRTQGGAGAPDPADDLVLASETLDLAESNAFGRGPEPEGTLELVDGSSGGELAFRLRVPEELAGRSAEARVFLSFRRADADFAKRTGILLDPRAFVAAGTAVAAPGQASVQITLRLPPELSSASRVFQAVWRRGERRVLTDAVELAPAR